MAFPMVHMCVAKKIAELNPNKIKNLPQFYLGNLAPDGVHFRENFEPENKKISHLCVGNEKWGEVSNFDEWTENVLTFLDNNKGSDDIDFKYGYCTHIITDIRNGADFWVPLKLKLKNSLKSEDVDAYYSEARKESRSDEINADNRLYKAVFQNEIQKSLIKSKGVAIRGIITAEEVNSIRDNILYNQYKGITPDCSYVGKYVTYEMYLNYIDKTAKIASKLVFG